MTDPICHYCNQPIIFVPIVMEDQAVKGWQITQHILDCSLHPLNITISKLRDELRELKRAK